VGVPNHSGPLPFLAVTLSVLLSSCSGASSTTSGSAFGSAPVSFTTSDGVRLSGRVFGPQNAGAGVVLTHMLPADQTSWFAEAAHLGGAGYRVLTFDLRGYCPGGDGGCSEGQEDVNAAPTDLTAALAEFEAVAAAQDLSALDAVRVRYLGRGDGDAANRGALEKAVGDVVPIGAPVGRLPSPAAGRAEVEHACIRRVARHRANPAAPEGTDQTEFNGFQQVGCHRLKGYRETLSRWGDAWRDAAPLGWRGAAVDGRPPTGRGWAK